MLWFWSFSDIMGFFTPQSICNIGVIPVDCSFTFPVVISGTFVAKNGIGASTEKPWANPGGIKSWYLFSRFNLLFDNDHTFLNSFAHLLLRQIRYRELL